MGNLTISYQYKSQNATRPVFTCWKLAIEALEKGVEYTQSYL